MRLTSVSVEIAGFEGTWKGKSDSHAICLGLMFRGFAYKDATTNELISSLQAQFVET
jgi:hypothetical protein